MPLAHLPQAPTPSPDALLASPRLPEQSGSSLDHTACVPSMDVERADPLPFAGEAEPPPPVAQEVSGSSSDPDGTAVINVIRASTTLPFKTLAAESPAVQPADEPPPTLTLQQYASLRVEVAAHPDRLAETRRRYGIASEAQHRHLDEYWRSRLDAIPPERQELDRLVAHYQRWIRSKT